MHSPSKAQAPADFKRISSFSLMTRGRAGPAKRIWLDGKLTIILAEEFNSSITSFRPDSDLNKVGIFLAKVPSLNLSILL